MWLVASAANAQQFPQYVNQKPAAASIQTGDVLALVRGNNTFKLNPALIGGIPQPVINGQCIIGAGGVAIWGSCSGSGAAVSGVTNSDGTLTVTPTTGNVVAGLALGHANTWTAQQTFVAPVLGTPASVNLTNATGTAAGVTAGNVITNANLTGIVTSAGNTTAIANGAIPLAKLGGEVDGRCIVGAAGVWTALTCPGGGTGLTIGTSTISGGTTNRFLYDNAGVLGEAIIGSGLSFSSGTLSASGGGGGTGFGVDGGTSAQSVTGTGAISNATRLVKIASGWTTGTLTLPSIAALGTSDAAIAIVDGGFLVGGASLTVAVNAADSAGGIVGSAGNVASVGPYANAGDGLVFRVSGTHTWTVESSSTLAAKTCPTNQVFNSIDINNLGCVQLGFGNLSGTAIAVQLPADVAYTDISQPWIKGQAVTPTAGGTQSPAGTLTPDFSASNSITATFGAGNLTIANPTNVKVGQSYMIVLTQDSVGSRTITAWGGNYKWAGGTAPTLSTNGNAKDVIACFADTTATINCALAVKGAS